MEPEFARAAWSKLLARGFPTRSCLLVSKRRCSVTMSVATAAHTSRRNACGQIVSRCPAIRGEGLHQSQCPALGNRFATAGDAQFSVEVSKMGLQGVDRNEQRRTYFAE